MTEACSRCHRHVIGMILLQDRHALVSQGRVREARITRSSVRRHQGQQEPADPTGRFTAIYCCVFFWKADLADFSQVPKLSKSH